MNNVTQKQLSEIIAKYLKSNKISIVGFEANKNNVAGLIDKVGATFMIDGEEEEELAFMDATSSRHLITILIAVWKTSQGATQPIDLLGIAIRKVVKNSKPRSRSIICKARSTLRLARLRL